MAFPRIASACIVCGAVLAVHHTKRSGVTYIKLVMDSVPVQGERVCIRCSSMAIPTGRIEPCHKCGMATCVLCQLCHRFVCIWHSYFDFGPLDRADWIYHCRDHPRNKELDAMKVKGNSQISDAPILAAAFWKPGTSLSGKVSRHVDTSNGPITEIKLGSPVEIDGRKHRAVMIGNHAGLRMCADSAGVSWPYPIGAHVDIKATGVQKTPKGKMVMFEVEFDIPEYEDLIEGE